LRKIRASLNKKGTITHRILLNARNFRDNGLACRPFAAATGRRARLRVERAIRGRQWAATGDAALLFTVMARYAVLARRVDQPAALLAVPEVAWTGFATVLSTTVAAINGR
jgi:hypothetical protein